MQSDEDLIQFFLMGDLNEDGFRDLSERLAKDSDLAKKFADLTRLDSALYENYSHSKLPVEEKESTPEFSEEDSGLWSKLKSFLG